MNSIAWVRGVPQGAVGQCPQAFSVPTGKHVGPFVQDTHMDTHTVRIVRSEDARRRLAQRITSIRVPWA